MLLMGGRFNKNLIWRAFGFYIMYLIVSFGVVALIVGVISPKHPAPANWPDWTIQYVLGQLESLQSMSQLGDNTNMDALYVVTALGLCCAASGRECVSAPVPRRVTAVCWVVQCHAAWCLALAATSGWC